MQDNQAQHKRAITLFDVSRYPADSPLDVDDVVIIEILDSMGNGQQPPKTLTIPLPDLPRLIWKLYQSLDDSQQGTIRRTIADNA